ncbi:hypothetical protein Pme01_35740 [Planosporangium mesophilum]|uniref:Uncharacterized protein n=1 Tax=Planosporangium mesophilum TaxID=689768 RepID=A0A8J3X145_9ACTN|nr:hypothetical protein Pme01_35740 [Planosporangium mesophilum]
MQAADLAAAMRTSAVGAPARAARHGFGRYRSDIRYAATSGVIARQPRAGRRRLGCDGFRRPDSSHTTRARCGDAIQTYLSREFAVTNAQAAPCFLIPKR